MRDNCLRALQTALLFLLLTALAQTAAQSPATWAAVLDAYAAGRFDIVESAAVHDLINRGASDYLREATRWAASQGPDGTRRSERTSATLLLDLLNEALSLRGASFDQLKKCLETYCERARREPTDSWTESWFAASVAVLAGAKDAAVLLDGQRLQHGNLGCSVSDRFGHACHALAVFPERTEFRLAAIMAMPVIAVSARGPDAATAVRLSGIGTQLQEVPTSDLLTLAIDLFGRVDGRPEVRAEARMRRGVLVLRQGRVAASLTDFSAALRSLPDRFTEYLAHLYSGIAYELLHQPEQAAEAYRRAVRLNPDALSARVALAAVLFGQGARDEAVAVTRETGLDTKSSDPWRQFSTGTFRHWSTYRRELREKLRQ